MKNQKGFTSVELIMVLIFVFLAVSYIVNAYKLSGCDFEPNYKCEFIHGVGLIPTLQIVTVWFDTDEK